MPQVASVTATNAALPTYGATILFDYFSGNNTIKK
jgi:hypothetical protein